MPANPHVMQAIIQDGYGVPERVLQLAETAVPSIGAGDVLVRVRATSVNTPDWATVAGAPYIMRPGIGLRRPRRPVRGSDFAGVVQAGPHVSANVQQSGRYNTAVVGQVGQTTNATVLQNGGANSDNSFSSRSVKLTASWQLTSATPSLRNTP